jgi:hypothetical protein
VSDMLKERFGWVKKAGKGGVGVWGQVATGCEQTSKMATRASPATFQLFCMQPEFPYVVEDVSKRQSMH